MIVGTANRAAALAGGRPVPRWAQFARASEIATVLWANGFGWLVDAGGLQACASLRCRVHCAIGFEQCPHHVAMDQPLPERLRDVLERLGPTFVKAGQMLALRPDYVPVPYAEALRSLHAAAQPFDSVEASGIVESELGSTLGRLFAEFEPEPFAAASLSQVHRARLADGTLVAVKVQRPGVADQVDRDLALLRWLAMRAERRYAERLPFRPTAAVSELADYTRRELDFRTEARTAARLRELFAGDEQVLVPRVYPELSSSRVLTSELVEGVAPRPAEELRRAGLDPERLLQAGAAAMVRQIFEFGLFHADPHPGNLLFTPGNRVCFLDFGMFGRLGRTERRRAAVMLWALVSSDYDAVAAQLLHMSRHRPGADPDGFRAALSGLVEEWFEQGSYSMARLLLHELALGGTYGIVFPRQLMLLARALMTLESTARLVRPGLDLAELTAPLMPQLRHIVLPTPTSLADAWQQRRFDYLTIALDLPDLLPDTLQAIRDSLGAPTGREPTPLPARATSGARTGLALLAGLVAGAIITSRRAARASRNGTADRR